MKIIYLANVRMPTERAHGLQIAKMCEALAAGGAEVELVVPKRLNEIRENLFAYYGVQPNFTVKVLPSWDLTRFGFFGFLIQTFTFVVSAMFSLGRADVIYSRDEMVLFPLTFTRRFLAWETHTGSVNFFARRVARKAKRLICLTSGAKNFYVERGIEAGKILVAPDGVDLHLFSGGESKEELRKKLGLPLDKKIITYTGSLAAYDWKGIDTMLLAAPQFDDQFLFLLVGGDQSEIEELIKKYPAKNVLFIPHQPNKIIPDYLKVSDVLVLPNKLGNPISERFTSPMKLFEYLAAGEPIASSSLPSVKEILTDETVVFFTPNDPLALAQSIKIILSNPDLGDRLGAAAKKLAQNFTWTVRAEQVIKFLQNGK